MLYSLSIYVLRIQMKDFHFQGNDHIMEYNHIHHMCWNSSDCGAIHSGRDWTWVGLAIFFLHSSLTEILV